MKVKLLFLLVLCLGCKAPYNPDNDPDVLDWYVDGQDTIIYTKQDSIKDAYERRIFVDSIYYADEDL